MKIQNVNHNANQLNAETSTISAKCSPNMCEMYSAKSKLVLNFVSLTFLFFISWLKALINPVLIVQYLNWDRASKYSLRACKQGHMKNLRAGNLPKCLAVVNASHTLSFVSSWSIEWDFCPVPLSKPVGLMELLFPTNPFSSFPSPEPFLPLSFVVLSILPFLLVVVVVFLG